MAKGGGDPAAHEDFAHQMRWLADEAYPEAEVVRVVALVHGNRGRKPRNSVPGDDVAATTVILASEKYVGFNHSHLTEVLAEREGIQLSRQTISRLLNRHGLISARDAEPNFTAFTLPILRSTEY